MQSVQTWNSQNGLSTNLPATPHDSTDDTVVNLSEYLAAQRKYLGEAEGRGVASA